MSQFFGFINLGKQSLSDDVADKMMAAMSFFTPDNIGVYKADNVFICNKLLLNSPESVNTSELCQSERYVLAASCRIDNREELHQKLVLEGDVFGENAISDHEIILKTFEKYGNDCVKHLIGDFAFVIWDKVENTLFMAKDHLGVRPMFYYQENGILIFSTSIIGIKACFEQHLEINQKYIATALHNYPHQVEDTFFEKIQRLKPAHFAVFESLNNSVTEKRYWELDFIDISALDTETKIYAELNKRFEEAIKCRIRTQKNIGCQLSGGMDSSAIAVIISRLYPKERLQTFSFVLNDKTRAFSERGIDEQGTQNAIIEYADLIKENHHPIEDFHFKDVFEQMEIQNKIMGGYADSDAIWQDSLFKEESKYNVGVSFSGFPGDECVSNNGGLYHYDFIGNRDFTAILKFIKDFKLRAIKRILDYYLAKKRGNFVKGYDKIQAERNCLNPDSKYNKTLKDSSFAFKNTFKEHLKSQICRQHTCLRTESEGAYALQYGIETVYPLADIRLVELAYSLPTEMFRPKPYTRAIFRNMCKNILPDQVRLQPKFSGAMTLAFAEYWHKRKVRDFENYKILNKLFLLNTKPSESDTKKHEIDWFINRNY